MNILLIDGYNVIHALPKFRKFLDIKLQQARTSLIQSLARLAHSKNGNVEIHVFFDGKAGADFFSTEPAVPHVDVHFSEGGTADELLLDYLENLTGGHEVTVVTDDKSLARQAGTEGATILGSEGLGRRFEKVENEDRKRA